MRWFNSGTNGAPAPRCGGVPTNWGGNVASSTRFAATRVLATRTMSRSLPAMYCVVALLGLLSRSLAPWSRSTTSGVFVVSADGRRLNPTSAISPGQPSFATVNVWPA